MRFLIAIGLWAALAGSALAASATSNVGGASVDKGKASAEVRFGYTTDGHSTSNDDRFRMREHLDYGLTDMYALRFIFAQDKRSGDDLEHTGVTMENRFQLIERRDHGWDGGFRLSYAFNDPAQAADSLTLRLTADVPVNETLEWTHNTLISHEIGEDAEDGIALELRNQLLWDMDVATEELKGLKLGVELFNDFGGVRELHGYDEQEHQIGPVVKLKFDHGFGVQLGYRAGFSRSGPDHMFKLAIARSF